MMFSRFLHTYKAEVIIFLAAFLLRMLLFGFFVAEDTNMVAFPHIGSDSKYYLSAAESLLQNGRFIYLDNLEPNSYETPGYPVFLAFFTALFGNLLAVSFIQNIILYNTIIIYNGQPEITRQ